MGLRKHNMSKKKKMDKKNICFAKLNSCPTSPRKMRLVADLIRGLKVEKALNILKFSSKDASLVLEKLVFSAISNWQNKNSEDSLGNSFLYIKSITVDSAGMLKRLRPAPQGRGHRIRKRSNHVTVVIENKKNNDIKVSE